MTTPEPARRPRGRRARRRAPLLAAAGLALATSAGCGGDGQDGPHATPPPDHGLPRPHGPGTDLDYPSQQLHLRPRVGMDFSVHLPLDRGASADWRVVDPGDDRAPVRYRRARTVDGAPKSDASPTPGERTRSFVFHAATPGATTLTLRETTTGRTMTYQVTVVEHGATGPERQYPSPPPDTPLGRKVADTFEGTVTVRRGDRFAVANRYSNVPGITWRVRENTRPEVASPRQDGERPTVTGNPDGERRDWYTFTARRPGTTRVTLEGCYRCASPTSPKSAESRKFSATRTLTIRVR